ncbi:MAG: hypothetical protein ABJA82_13055, partial [Myxococcales bacterium]
GGSSGFGTGGGTIIGGGTGGAAVTGGFAVANGYVTGAGWMGYGYTYVGPMVGSKATITPATFEGLTQLCATGSIAADPTFASVAGMGFSVNQANTPMPPILTAPTSGTGLSINVSVTGLTLAPGAGSQLRAQLKSAGGDFCAPIPAAGTSTIPWASFNKTCWDTTAVGNAAFVAGTAITAVEVLVPSAMTAIPTFMVCLLDAHAK